MNYLSIMTEDEMRYVCSVIPLQHTIGYFKQNPKDFAKVMPGFRAKSLKNQEQVSGVLYRNRNQHFISSYIEKHINRWLDEIGAAINERIEDGESKESALLLTLPHCFFVDNIRLYFKLSDEEHSEDFLSLLSAGVKIIKDSDIEREKSKAGLETRTNEVSRVKTELERVQSELDKANRKLSDRLDEIEKLKRANSDLEKLKNVIFVHEQSVEQLKQKAEAQEDYIQQLKAGLSAAKDEQLQLEQKIKDELIKQQEMEMSRQSVAHKPKCPEDLDEFKNYLGYNFENIGLSTRNDYYPLLKDHLCEILFQGKPIIISRSSGLSLMKCVSNTLVNTPVVPTLEFADNVTEKLLSNYLSQNNRIVCLDNFIGNYNETTLITLCDGHKDKIIFLTVAYDHTLAYVPDELLRYCHYLNLNRIEAFSSDNELTEDPSHFDESETVVIPTAPDLRWSVFLKETLEELGLRGALSIYKQSLVTNELTLCRLLAYDILPYCTDVLQITPFNVSERLVKYAGNSGRCPYKDLFGRWFA